MKYRWGGPPGAHVDGIDAAICAWAADLCNQTLSKEPSKEERKYATLVRTARDHELAAKKEFEVCRPINKAHTKQTIVDTRWVSTRKVIDKTTSAKARLVISGFKGPDLRQGLVETANCVSLRSPHLQLPPLRAWQK